MNASVWAVLAVSTVVAAPAAPPPEARPTVVAPSATSKAAGSGAQLPLFAAQLADSTTIAGPDGWVPIAAGPAWAAIAASTPETRQAARWAYARSLIGSRRGPEAVGVLQTMLADEPELALVDNFRIALGAARAVAGDARGALSVLGSGATDGGAISDNSEACAWRLWSFAALGEAEPALKQIRCSLKALNARPLVARAPFLYAGAHAALAAGRPELVSGWLRALPDGDPGANLYRGRAALALGDLAGGRLRLARVDGSNRQHQADARLSLIEADLASAPATPEHIAAIDRFALTWRGDAIEQRVLGLSYRIGRERKDLARSLRAGGALVRYFPTAPGSQQTLAELQQLLADSLAPESSMPVADAAGLYWEFRDLAPIGARGDLLASQLARRLELSGLYERAADLLRHQLVARTTDIAQGPLSARVAGLYIRAGRPDVALSVLRASEFAHYPASMQWQRHRMAAVALAKLGRHAEALAVIQDLPDASEIRAEIFWQGRDWPALVSETANRLPGASPFDAAEQTLVLRHAIALAMLGHEPALARLRARYLPAFAGRPAAGTFDLLTRDTATLQPEVVTSAMLALPSVSPAGEIGDLLEVPTATTATGIVPRPVPSTPARTADAAPATADNRPG